MKNNLLIPMLLVMVLVSGFVSADQHKKPNPSLMSSKTLSGLKLRAIGPALMSGRISDIAIDCNG